MARVDLHLTYDALSQMEPHSLGDILVHWKRCVVLLTLYSRLIVEQSCAIRTRCGYELFSRAAGCFSKARAVCLLWFEMFSVCSNGDQY